ncbi:HD domain-containing protein [Chitinibacter fontanus]|uniref:HD domain-containing protein n=1 Tax=Chitinibacter fontanus TaxID=1737446 RepID=A0A7D5VAN2_9NEIS|nr:HD domain-containing phosphohydrolase [Chitinibacter fontanus]QLI82331.1 HD domain-containing protein [Chitinibacter fontanus]
MSTSSPSSLQLIRQARLDLEQLLRDPLAAENFPASVNAMVQMIQLACQQSAEVALGTILLEIETPYPIRHAVDVAIVAELSLINLGQNTIQRASVIAAALTMNIGMHALESLLAAQEGPLSNEQRAQMQAHPQIGRDQLRMLGVSDIHWLDCVEQHHEAPDGSGYPRKLKGSEILFEARLLSLADRYCAMLSNRGYRRRQLADAAMFSALNSDAGSLDQKLAQLFISTLGLYPPGSVVHLINGETAVVVQRGKLDSTPLVLSLFNENDQLLPKPVLRNSAEFDCSVINLLDSRIIAGQLPLDQIWGDVARA